MKTRVPGPRSRRLARLIARYESPNVTCLGPPGPIFWERAKGANVWDVDGNRYLDLSSAFGVASLGHTPDPIRRAITNQAARLMHGMGDVHPTELKAQLLRAISRVTFERWTGGRLHAQTVLGNSGFEAVEIALKTALLKTRRAGVLAFEGGYHGLGYGALLATWRPDFRRPFLPQLRPVTRFLPYPTPEQGMGRLVKRLPALLKTRRFGAVVVEPIQGRAGVVFPPDEFLPFLRHWCDRTGTLLVVDEIFTGFWRTGRMFAVEHSGVIPDLICLGKALTGALPLSACAGKPAILRAWPKSRGEAIHTSTFLGNPLACAAALASIRAFEDPAWEKRINKTAESLWELLVRAFVDRPHRAVRWLRGSGMAFGIEMAPGTAVRVCQRLLAGGIIALAEGNRSETLAILPPLTATAAEMRFAIGEIRKALDELA